MDPKPPAPEPGPAEAQVPVLPGSVLASPPVPRPPTTPEEVRRYVAEPLTLWPGNQLRLLRDGREAFPAMLAAIDRAQRYVHLETFIFADDLMGHRVAKALAQAAARGVEVTVLYDAVGSWESHSGFFAALRRKGVKALPYNPVAPWRGGLSPFKRDHRKLLAVDGETAFVGGLNISDDWAPPEFGGHHWRDDVMQIDGPAVTRLSGLFRATFQSTALGLAKDLVRWRYRTAAPPVAEARGDVAVSILASRKSIHQAYQRAIDSAQHTVLLGTGYFVPDGVILRSLRRARLRGVRVALLLPARSDHFSAVQAGRALYGRLLRWGVEIYEWDERIFHAKSAVVDGVWGTMGSFNMDRWSLDFSHELNAFFCDERIGHQLAQSFERDFARSQRITREGWLARPWTQRAMEWFYGQFARWM